MIDPATREKLLEHLRANSIVSYACQKAGVSRATYYRWIEEDAGFRAAAEAASSIGAHAICDMAESVILKSLKEGNECSAKFVLTRRHPAYRPQKPQEPEAAEFVPIGNIVISEVGRCADCNGDLLRKIDPTGEGSTGSPRGASGRGTPPAAPPPTGTT